LKGEAHTDGLVAASLADKVEHVKDEIAMSVHGLTLEVANCDIVYELADRSNQRRNHLLEVRVKQV